VALVPESVAKLTADGIDVLVQAGAGESAFFLDDAYKAAGATISPDAQSLFQSADIIVKVQRPDSNDGQASPEIAMMQSGAVLIGFLQPLFNPGLANELAEQNITSFSMDAVPRIARAQSMDALSSMSSIAGYKTAIIAAESLGIYLPMMVTAAGTTPPAKGLILGAGVAGLQAIATARRLGAVVKAFDVRPAVKEQVESLGATFIEEAIHADEAEDEGGYATQLNQEAQHLEQDLIHRHAKESDFIITTALIPGRDAPILVTKEMVQDMHPGAVIVDMAAEAGGNCELTVPGETVVVHGVTIHGPLDIPSTVPVHASQLYSRNMLTLLQHLIIDGELHFDFEDTITKECCITYDGKVVHEPTLALLAAK
jgi:NAD(P) transhydrogenase subunit alpha